jgi:proteasome assembly chaperone (PAC2) family protein
MLKHRGFFVSRQGRVVKIVLERAKACGRHFPGAKEARIEEVGVGAALPKMAQGDAFGAEAENHFIDDGKDEGVRYLLWGEPGRGLLGGGGLLLHFPNTGVGEWKSFLGSALLRG